MEEGSHWVAAKVKGVAQDQVTHRTALDADLALLHELLKVRVHG